MNHTSFLRSFLAITFLFMAPAYANGKPDVGAALTKWVATVESGNVDNVMKLYDDNAIMISTFVDAPMTSRADIVGYFKKALANPDIKVEVTESHPRVFGNMAVNTGLYTLSYTEDGEPVEIQSRFSFVYILRDGKWLIVDHHSSKVPGSDGAL
jgi:uncharacterized protein (TIGR02246 family)